jgi:hypothetical protein
VVRGLLAEFVRGHEDDIVNHPHHRLHLLTVRGKRALEAPGNPRAELRGFAAAALHNFASRERLARMMERVVIGDRRETRTGCASASTVFTPIFPRSPATTWRPACWPRARCRC